VVISDIVMKISAAVFKAECLKLMDQVQKTREPVVITKYGKAVAQLAPVSESPQSLFGYMKNTVKFEGDIVGPLDVEWSALSGDEDRLYGQVPVKRSRKK